MQIKKKFGLTILLVFVGISVCFSSILPSVIAQEEKSIDITSWGFDSRKCPNPYFINWNSTGYIESVKIVLLDMEYIWVYMIVQETANDGDYSWNFPKGYELVGYYYLKISDTNNPNINDTVIYYFNTINAIDCPSERISSYSIELMICILFAIIGIIAIPLVIKLGKRNNL